MIAEVTKAIEAYSTLTPAGKRLFRDEIGLKGHARGTGRRRAASKQGSGVKRGRTRRVSELPPTPADSTIE